jgi:hypothetical protein
MLRMSRPRRILGVVLTLIPAIVVTLAHARTAQATSNIAGTVTQVEYNAGDSTNPQLMVQVNNVSSVNYYAQQNSPGTGCPALSADTIKAFLSLSQTLLLSQKSVRLYFNVCNGFSYLSDIVMTK